MKDFQQHIQRYLAYTSVGASTLRGQGVPGLVARYRTLLGAVDLNRFKRCQPAGFPALLDEETTRIKLSLPRNARHWGVIRKVLNIFLRGASYNCFLRDAYRLHRLEASLEIPLDSYTADALIRRSPPHSLPRWKGMQKLTPDVNEHFQLRAMEIAGEEGTSRVHLDLMLWLDR